MTAVELEWLRAIRDALSPLKPLAAAITEFGDEIVIFLLIAVVYFAVSKELGEKIAFVALASSCVNGLFKSAVARPRPFTYDPGLASERLIARYADSYSFPSGHAQNAGAVYTALARRFPRRAVVALSVAAMLLVPFSRLLLGVHFPSDVCVGLALGILCALLFGRVIDLCWKRRDTFYPLLAGAILLAMLCVCLPLSTVTAIDADTIKALGALTGMALGCYIEKNWIGMADARGFGQRLMRVVWVAAVLVGLKFGLERLFSLIGTHFVLDYLRYLITIAGALAFCPWVIQKLGF